LPLFAAILFSFSGAAQSSYLPQGSKFDHFLDRMEILQQTDPDLNISTAKPISRRLAVRVAEIADSLHKFYPYDELYHLSKVDRDNLSSLMMNNAEWVRGQTDSFQSKKPLLNAFYKDKANFYEVREKDFFLAVNPAIQQTQSYETGNKQRVFLNSKGVTLRGVIADKLGFSAYLTDNQERGSPGSMPSRVRVITNISNRRASTISTTGHLFISTPGNMSISSLAMIRTLSATATEAFFSAITAPPIFS